ncbi:hypothetical protein Dimus_038188 [Dionaea muscipula]
MRGRHSLALSSGQGRGIDSSYLSGDDSTAEHVDSGALYHGQYTLELSADTPSHVPSSYASPDPPTCICPSEPRVELRLRGTEIYATDHSQVAQKVSSCIRNHYNGCYPNWSHTPIGVRDLWFEEFKVYDKL